MPRAAPFRTLSGIELNGVPMHDQTCCWSLLQPEMRPIGPVRPAPQQRRLRTPCGRMGAATCNSHSRHARVLALGGQPVSDGCASTNRDLGEGGFGVTMNSSGVGHLTVFSKCRCTRRTSLACDNWWHVASTPLRCFTLSDQVSRPDSRCHPSAATRRSTVPWSGESNLQPSASGRDEIRVMATRLHERASPFDRGHGLRCCRDQRHPRERLSITAVSGRTSTRLEVARRLVHPWDPSCSYTSLSPTGCRHRATQAGHSTPSSADSRSVCTWTNFRCRSMIDRWPQSEHSRRGLSLRCSWPNCPSRRRSDLGTSSTL